MSASEYNKISGQIVHSAIEVHKILGPGLLESVYEKTLIWEMKQNGLYIKRQTPIDIQYKNLEIKKGYYADIIVNNKIILEIKAIENILPVHKAQLLSYLKLTDLRLGLLLNFHVPKMVNGITRIINGYL